MIKNRRDFVSGLLFVVVGAVFAAGATNYSMGDPARPGAGYFPLILGVLLALLGIVVVFKSLTIDVEQGNPIGTIAWRPLLVICGAITVFGASLPRLGMFLAVPLLIVMVSGASSDFRWKGVLISCLVLTIGCWLIFVLGLNLTIPLKPSFGG